MTVGGGHGRSAPEPHGTEPGEVDRSASSRGRTTWLASVGVLTLAAWLFLPRERAGPREGARLRAVLVDASASVVRSPSWLAWARAELAREARAAEANAEELHVLSFAAGVATGFPAGPADAGGDPARFLRALAGGAERPFDPALSLARDATELAQALEAVAPALLDERRPPGELVLLAPPAFTGASPAAALARLVAGGVALRVSAPPPPASSDLGLLALELAPRVEAGARLVARARFVWHAAGPAPAGPAWVELELENEAGTRTLRQAVPLPAAAGEFELPLECGLAAPGRNELRARCRLSAGPDFFPENDRARALTTAEGARVLGVVSPAELRPAAEAWLAPAGQSALAGLQFVFLSPEELAPELAGLSALVSFDLGPSDLPEPLVAAFVRAGGGWLALSGWHFLDDWMPGFTDGELHRMLPCEPESESALPRDVVLLVDGSGSMDGAPFESVRAATLELVAAALPSDRVSLRFFTVRLEREHLLKERSASRAEDVELARRAAQELLALRVPSGTTFLLHSVRELGAELGEHETLVLLLTDGWERDALSDVLAEARAVATELARARARLVVIAVGEPNLPVLAALAGGEERVRAGRTLADLRAVFRRELSGARVAEGEFALHLAARAPGSLADEVASRTAEPVLAPLERYVRNQLRPGAEALWESATGEPVLALARAGLGRTALFASRPTPEWAGRYARAGLGQPAEFEGLLRWLARGPESAGGAAPAPRARLAQGRLILSGLDPRTPAELGARLVDLGGAHTAEELSLRASGRLPTEVLRTRSARPRGRDWEAPIVLVPGTDARPPELALPVELGLADEFAWRERGVPPAWLEPDPDVAARSDGTAARAHPAAPWVLSLGLVLLFGAGLGAGRGRNRDQGVPGSSR